MCKTLRFISIQKFKVSKNLLILNTGKSENLLKTTSKEKDSGSASTTEVKREISGWLTEPLMTSQT